MGIRTILTLSALSLFCAFSRATEPTLPQFDAIEADNQADNFGLPPAGIDAEEFQKIKDKLSTSLFFRGELADSVIEADYQNRLVPVTGKESHADIRLKLLNWIQKNGDKAANLYFYLKNHGADPSAPPLLQYEEWWEFNPHFLEMIAAVNKAAKDSAVPAEEVSLIAQRLFGGHQAQGAAYAPRFGAGSCPGPAPQGSGSAVGVDYADYKLDPANAEREAKAISGLVEGLKNALEEELARRREGEDLTESLTLSGEAFALYKRFIVALSELKGRRNITGAQSKNLETLRRALRKKLAGLKALYARKSLRARGAVLPAGSPGADILRKEALKLQGAFEAFGAGEKDGEGRRLYELQSAADFWTFKFSAYMRLAALKSRIEGAEVFSCVLDRVVFEWLARFFPAAGYARLRKELAVSAAGMAAALEGVAAGDYSRVGVFAGGSPEALFKKMEEIERKLAVLEACSRRNRRLQFLLWDAFLNPPGLEPATKGIRARNKLLF
ncbi:MAG: hypothetical protein HY796_08750 [Elusimicrobia bacterium]|nr:hypothetical protein [Elusimicrobiota bacterium]